MRKRTPTKPAIPASRPWFTRRLLGVTVTVVAAAGLVFGLGQVGELARQHLGPRDRYRVSFAEIECDAPPGKDRAAFLSEVRYVSNFPASFQLLDPDLSAKLSTAFAAHPWVESFDGIEREPPTHVRVKLRFRTPVLAVHVRSSGVRLVDGNGVLLPLTDQVPDVAELAIAVRDPETAAGKVWEDATVQRALELVKAYHPRRLEKSSSGWKLTGQDGKVFNVSG